MKRLALAIGGVFMLLGAIPVLAQGIQQLGPWFIDGSGNITQLQANKAIKITGLTTGQCLTLNGSGVLTTTSCGSGGGSSGGFDFPTILSWGNATSTTLGFGNGFVSQASSTVVGLLTTTFASSTSASVSDSFTSGNRLFGANLSN